MDFAEIIGEATPKYFQSIHSMLFSVKVKGPDQRLTVLRMDVLFLITFSRWFEPWGFIFTTSDDEEIMENLRCFVTSLKLIWPKESKALSLLNRLAQSENDPFDDLEMKDFHLAAVELEAKIQQTKGQVECWTQILMRSSLQFNSSTYFWVFKDLFYILSIHVQKFSKYAEIVPFLQKQLDILEAKIQFLLDSFYIAEY